MYWCINKRFNKASGHCIVANDFCLIKCKLNELNVKQGIFSGTFHSPGFLFGNADLKI